MDLKINGIKEGKIIPEKYTCEGENVNPLIEIVEAPEGTKSLALVMDDPDASSGGTWDHWLVWNLQPKTKYIHEDGMPEGAIVGKNSWGRNRYGGPCPPIGDKAHRYFFKIYALDIELKLGEDAGKTELERAMGGHVLAQAQLMGLYQRK